MVCRAGMVSTLGKVIGKLVAVPARMTVGQATVATMVRAMTARLVRVEQDSTGGNL